MILRLELTLPTFAEDLALDEALLLEAERGEQPVEVLRLWESAETAVVVGSSSHVAAEVDEAACRQMELPVLRRVSGGAAVLCGPGCLMYSLVLSYERRPRLRSIGEAHAFVLGRIAEALAGKAPGVQRQGISDLALDGRKFSGNSVRCKRNHVLYHGTLLYDFPLELVERSLKMPRRQPDYRGGRAHGEFVTNLPLTRAELRIALVDVFDAREPRTDWPEEAVSRLVREKYSQRSWNYRS